MIKGVLFDLDDTLYDREALVLSLAGSQHETFAVELQGVPREQFVAEVLEMDNHGYGDKAIGYRRIGAGWGLAPDVSGRLCGHFWSYFDTHMVLPSDTAMTLGVLRAHGMRLGLVTNGGTDRQRCKLETLGLAGAFDTVLISEAEGVRKPSVEIFQRALRRCGVVAGEAVFVGDHPDIDIEGATNAGLAAIWKHVPHWTLATTGVPTVHRLADILPMCLAPSVASTSR